MQASSETSSAKANTDRNRWKQPSCHLALPRIEDGFQLHWGWPGTGGNVRLQGVPYPGVRQAQAPAERTTPPMNLRATALLFSVLLLPATRPLAAQGPVRTSGYHPVWWTTAEGLPGSFVTDITQAADGRLWFIAGGALTRFDGRSFEIVQVGENQGEATGSESPLGLARGGGDTLWVSTYSHRLLSRSRGIWSLHSELDGEPVEVATRPGYPPAVREEIAGTTYLWRPGGRLPGAPGVPFDASLRPSIAIDGAGTLWAVDEEGPSATSRGDGAPRRLELVTRRFVRTSDGGGPLGVRRSGDTLEVIDAEGRVRFSIPDGDERVPRLLTLNGQLLASTPSSIEIFSPDGGEPESIPLGSAGPALSVFEDREGGIWIGTNSGGLLELRDSPFEVYHPAPGNDGRSYLDFVARGADGSVLVLGDGLVRIRDGRMERVSLDAIPDGSRLGFAMEDSRGRLWVGFSTAAQEHAVIMRSPDGAVRVFEADHPTVEILEAADGSTLWLSPFSYCRVRLTLDGSGSPGCTDLTDWDARDLLVTRSGEIWIAGQRGVRVEGPGGVRLLTSETGYPLSWARALHEDADGVIWIGTYRGGLGRLVGDSLRMIRRRDGLAEDVVSTILEDETGTLWFGGNSGIHSVAKVSVEAFLAGRSSGVSSRSFDQRDGLPQPEGTGRQGVRDSGGGLWFPTFGGVVALPRDQGGVRTPVTGPVTIDRVVAGDMALEVSDTVRLPRGLRDLRLSVAGVSLRSPRTHFLEYRLPGYATAWTRIPGDGTLSLTRLPPGTSRLELRDATAVGAALGTTASMVLVVPPRFTETAWFYGLLLAGLAGLVLLVTRLRTRFLAAQARELAAEVREQTHWLEVERDRTVAALDQVRETGARLRNLLETKSRVFAGLSHELRTPMSLILAPLRELERQSEGAFPPEARGHLGTLSKAVHRLERLTAQFLDLADTQSGTLRLRRSEVDAEGFIRECVDSMRPVAEGRGVLVTMVAEPGHPARVHLDPDQMDKVVVNLLDNAIRHAPDGGRVELRLLMAGEGNMLVFEVSDNGPGIPAEYEAQVFDPFFQGPGATGGMGLGLSLCRDVVVLHGGRIEIVDSAWRGVTFRVTLPGGPGGTMPSAASLQPAGHAQGAPAARRRPTGSAAPAGEEAAAPRERLLVVEDEADLRGFLIGQFDGSHQVRGAGSAEEALEIIRGWRPHLVISDVMMPGLDGIGFCRILKSDPATRTVPVILLTALGDRDHQVRGLSSGADAYVVKPFDLEQLALRVENLLRLRKGVEDRFQAAMPAWASVLYRAGAEDLDESSEGFLEQLYAALVKGIGDPDLDVDGVARALHVSRSSLYRKVRTLLDCSPMDLLAEVRLEQAALRLRTTGDAVSTIAKAVGFRSAAHFSTRFSAHFGLTPTAYRKSQSEGRGTSRR